MWTTIVQLRKNGEVVRVFGPFDTSKEATAAMDRYEAKRLNPDNFFYLIQRMDEI